MSFGNGAGHTFYGRQNTLQTAMLYGKLQMLFHEAKQMGPSNSITNRTRCVAEEYAKLGSKFGTKLGNAVDSLYTFVSHPGMHPTNNESERMLRKVMIHRKIRQRLVTNGGMRTFEVIMTWGKQNLELSGKLLEVLWAT